MRWTSLLFLVTSLFGVGQTNALTTYYATQGFTPPGGCASSTAGALNVIVSLPVPAGADGLQVKEVSYALRGTTTQPGTMTITANSVTASANPANAYLCCSANYCDLATYTIGLGQSWYEGTCGNPQCGTAQQWYRLPFTTGWYPTNGAGSLGVNIEFGGAGVSLANFGSGSSFFVSYYARFPSPSPTPTTTRTPTITMTSTPTSTTTATPTPTETTTPTETPSASASQTPSESTTPTPTETPSPSASQTPSESVTSTITPSTTPTQTSSISVSVTSTSSSSISATRTPMPSSSATPSSSISSTSTATTTPSVSVSPTQSSTPSPSVNPSPSPSYSPSVSISASSSTSSSSSPSFSRIPISSQPTMSDFNNSTSSSSPTNTDSSTAMILSGTTVGITGLMMITYVLNYLRRSGALSFLRSVGINIPINTTAKTDEERKDDEAGANSVLGKAATLINKVKDEKEQILKVVDNLPLPEQLKYAAHNPKSLLSKPTQKKLESLENDLEKALPAKKIVVEEITGTTNETTTPKKITLDTIEVMEKYLESFGLKLPPHVIEKARNAVVERDTQEIEEIETIDEDYTEALEEQKQEVQVEPNPIVTPVVAKKTRRNPSTNPPQAKKATLEVNEHELAEIKLILANKKKQFNVV